MKVKVPVYGTVGKVVVFDPEAGARAEAAVALLASQISTGLGATIVHKNLQGLQVGDDHPQYTMWQASEVIQATWNFAVEPDIEGVSLTEFIEDVVGDGFVQDTPSILWSYLDTAGELEADVNEAWAPTWTANHRWTDNDEIQLGTGGDLRLYHDGTNSLIANSTGNLTLSTTAGDINFNPVGTYPTSGDIRYTRDHTGLTRFIIRNNSVGTTAGTQLTFNNGSTIGGAIAYAGQNFSGPYLFGGPSGPQLVLYTSGDGINPSCPLVWGTNDVTRGYITADGSDTYFLTTNTNIIGRLTATKTDQVAVFLSGSSSSRSYVSFGTNVQKFLFGAPAGPNELVPGDVAGDMSWSINSGRMMMSFDASATAGFALGDAYMRLLKDNQPLQIGAGQDLQLNHDGTNSRITSVTGVLQFYDNATQSLALLSTYLRLVNDNQALQIGASQDLSLTHNGTNSVITNLTGSLNFLAGATTALTISSAGALSSATAGTWTGVQLFAGDFLSGASFSLAVNGTYIGNQQGLHPSELFVNSGGATDAKLWEHTFNTTNGIYRLLNDAFTVGKAYLNVTRAANVVTQIEYGNSTDNPIQIMNGQLRLTGEITPAQITGNTDNYAPTGLAGATVIRFSTDATRNITGLTGGAAGRVVVLLNVGTQTATLIHDATSTAANRFLLANNANKNVVVGGSFVFWYDTTSSRWRHIANST